MHLIKAYIFQATKLTKPVLSSYGQYERRKEKSFYCQRDTSNDFTIKTTMAGSARSMRPTQIAPVQSTVTTSSQSLQWCRDGDLSDPKNVSCVRGPVWWKLFEKQHTIVCCTFQEDGCDSAWKKACEKLKEQRCAAPNFSVPKDLFHGRDKVAVITAGYIRVTTWSRRVPPKRVRGVRARAEATFNSIIFVQGVDVSDRQNLMEPLGSFSLPRHLPDYVRIFIN